MFGDGLQTQDHNTRGCTGKWIHRGLMEVLVKLVEKRDPKRAVNRYLMVYRATPHRMMGQSRFRQSCLRCCQRLIGR